MGSLVDRLARTPVNPYENGTSSKNQPLSRNACSIAQKSHGQKSDENEKKKSLRVQLLPFNMESSP